MSSSGSDDVVQKLLRQIEQLNRENERERQEKEIAQAAVEHERLEKEKERQEKEAEHQKRLVAEEHAKKSDVQLFLSKLSQDLLAIASSSRSYTTNLSATDASFEDLFPSLNDCPNWNDFQALWQATVEKLPSESCPEPLLQEQFRVLITRFLSQHGDMHLVDFSRSGLYGLNQKVDLLFCRGRQAQRLPTYFESCLVGELKASGQVEDADDSKLSDAVLQVYQRFAHIVQESGVRRRECWGFACNRTTIVFLSLRISDLESEWDYQLLQTPPMALKDDGLKGLCFLLSSESHALCAWNGAAPPVVSTLSSEIVSSLSVSPRLELTGMLQRAPVHGIGQMDAVELATATLDATTSAVVKCFPASKKAEWTTERGALQELSKIDWSDHRFWVPTLLRSEQSERGAILCTAPVGVPLPLASCYLGRALIFCSELLQQLMSIVLQCHDHGVHHMDICPQNVVLLEEVQTSFLFPVCLIDWGGASFMQKRDKKDFHYHAAFSPDWLDPMRSLANLTDGQRLQVCLQQTVLTVLYLAIGDVLSWLPPVAIFLDESTHREKHTRMHNKSALFRIRARILNDVLNPSLSIPALDTDDRRPVRSFLQRLHHEFPSLFELKKRSSANALLVGRIPEICATFRG
eukprot:ANDGO_07414.mRNA.1 hypothetical protein